MNHAAELGWKTAMELAQAGGRTHSRVHGTVVFARSSGLSKDAATQVAAQAASEIASEASRSAGKICATRR